MSLLLPAMLLHDIRKLERHRHCKQPLGEFSFHYVANYWANVILTNLPIISPPVIALSELFVNTTNTNVSMSGCKDINK